MGSDSFPSLIPSRSEDAAKDAEAQRGTAQQSQILDGPIERRLSASVSRQLSIYGFRRLIVQRLMNPLPIEPEVRSEVSNRLARSV